MRAGGTRRNGEVIVRTFYEELWNRWRVELVHELLSEGVRFRGSLGSAVVGRDAFRRYLETIREGFPDWHNRVDELIASDACVATRMTWTGTHLGRFGDVEPTGRRISYVGAAFFHVSGDGVIEDVGRGRYARILALAPLGLSIGWTRIRAPHMVSSPAPRLRRFHVENRNRGRSFVEGLTRRHGS